MIFIFIFLLISSLQADTITNVSYKWEISFGLKLLKGNTEQVGINSGFTFERLGPDYEFKIKGNHTYGESRGVKDVNKGDGDIRLDVNFLKRFTAFVLFLPGYNEFQKLDLKVSAGGGLKYTFIKNTTGDHSISLALLYDYWKYTELEKKMMRFSLRPMHFQKINEVLTLFFIVFYQPDVNNFQDYRIFGKLILNFKISKYFSFDVIVTDEYNNIVPSGVKRNDLTLINAIKIKIL